LTFVSTLTSEHMSENEKGKSSKKGGSTAKTWEPRGRTKKKSKKIHGPLQPLPLRPFVSRARGTVQGDLGKGRDNTKKTRDSKVIQAGGERRKKREGKDPTLIARSSWRRKGVLSVKARDLDLKGVKKEGKKRGGMFRAVSGAQKKKTRTLDLRFL